VVVNNHTLFVYTKLLSLLHIHMNPPHSRALIISRPSQMGVRWADGHGKKGILLFKKKKKNQAKSPNKVSIFMLRSSSISLNSGSSTTEEKGIRVDLVGVLSPSSSESENASTVGVHAGGEGTVGENGGAKSERGRGNESDSDE
jgi:hypothetical protein